MSNWKKTVSSSWKPALLNMGWMAVMIYGPQWLVANRGVSPFVALAVLGFTMAVWAAFHLLNTHWHLQRERAAIDAKYDAKMAELIRNARNAPHSD
jgi:hypothetical protein